MSRKALARLRRCAGLPEPLLVTCSISSKMSWTGSDTIWGSYTVCIIVCLWAVSCDFQQCDILTSVDSDEPVQPPLKLRSSKWCSESSLTVVEYSSDWQRLWSDCAYVQADLRLCWSHIPHCWKSHATALYYVVRILFTAAESARSILIIFLSKSSLYN